MTTEPQHTAVDELLPCPFCGGEAQTIVGMKPKALNGKMVDYPITVVRCKRGCRSTNIEGWNTRHEAAKPRHEVQTKADQPVECAGKIERFSNSQCADLKLFQRVADVICQAIMAKNPDFRGRGVGDATNATVDLLDAYFAESYKTAFELQKAASNGFKKMYEDLLTKYRSLEDECYGLHEGIGQLRNSAPVREAVSLHNVAKAVFDRIGYRVAKFTPTSWIAQDTIRDAKYALEAAGVEYINDIEGGQS